MNRRKKDIPLSVLIALEPYLSLNNPLYKIVDPGSSLLKYLDVDDDSEFFFEVTGYVIEKGLLYFYTQYKPASNNDTGIHKPRIEAKNLENILEMWADRLAKYQNVTTYEDLFLRQYENEFNDDYEQLMDDDADTNSFNLDQQIWIDSYLTEIKTKLLEFKTPENALIISTIQNDIQALKDNQSSMTKQKVFKSLSKIWAKMRKEGINIIKALYQEAKSELIKQLVSGGLDKAHHLLP